uniref:DUF6570 domain-containing protein n=1 Tax=Daphnia galeata TaxID=27404 RepID=A0A8J2RI58_9CRUS|nr:unnamed protein product [Daphnia galeata]
MVDVEIDLNDLITTCMNYHSSTANNNILNVETDLVNQVHLLKPLTSTRVIDHSSAANNNCLNVDTDQVDQLHLMKPLTITHVIEHSSTANKDILSVETDQMIRSPLFTSVTESSIRDFSVTNIGTAETISINSACHRRLHNPVYPSSRPSLEPSLNYEMNNFERYLRSALVIMAINTGLARFNGVSDLYIEDKVTVDIHDVPTKNIINNLVKEIETNLSPSTRGDTFENYRSQIDLSSDLIGCVSCDIPCDLRNTPPAFQAALSAYTSFNGDVYHMHPHLVKECSIGPIGETEAVAALCELCASSISKSKIPVNSIASGVDFGSAERIKLPKMSLAEEYVIGPRAIAVAIAEKKIYSANCGGCFPNASNAKNYISITFVGLKPQWDAFFATRRSDKSLIPELKVRFDVVYAWLRALKQLNPLYRDIQIDDTSAMTDFLDRIEDDLIREVTIIDSQLDMLIDQLVTPSAATDVTENLSDFSINNEINNSEAVSESENLERIPLPASFVNRPPSIPIGHGNSATVAFRGLIASLTGEIFDQLQRHAASRIVASRVKSDPKSFAAFASWIADPNFLSELKLAVANPLANSSSLRVLLANGPVGAAECFRLLTDAIFGILLGTPTEASMKRNTPLFKRKAGVFGVPIATFGCTEEQARGSLHMHALFCGGLPPHLLQTAGVVPLLFSAVAKALDTMVCAQLDPITHVENLISKFSTEKKTFRPSLVSVHHLIL